MPEDDECDKKRNTYRLRPKRPYLPFFAYDVFKPGEVAYSRIDEFIDKNRTIWHYGVDYPLDILNGVPFLFKGRCNYCHTRGALIYFKPERAYEAYKLISDTKSQKLYRWDTIYRDNIKMNVLVGRNDIIKIKDHENRGAYYGKEDPMITHVIYTIWDNVKSILSNRDYTNDFFNLQMNYIMLWSSVDRYLVLRFGKRDQKENLKCLAEEESFKRAVLKFADGSNETPKVFSNEDYRHFKLDRNKSLCCIMYYYTIRCNVVHMGKSIFDEYGMLKQATLELLLIYISVLRDSFEDQNIFNDIFDEIMEFWEKL